MDEKPITQKPALWLRVLTVVMTVFVWPAILCGLGYGTYILVVPYISEYEYDTLGHVLLATLAVFAAIAAFLVCLLAIALRLQGSSIPKMLATSREAGARQRVIDDEKRRLRDIAAEQTRLTTTVDGILSVIPETPTVFRYLAKDKSVGMVVDGTKGTVSFVTRGKDDVSSMRRYSFADILAVDLLEDGSSIARTQTNRISQIGGAIVGGLVSGGIGVVIGGLTGSTTTKTKSIVERIDVVVTVNDAARPSHVVNFYRQGWPYSVNHIKQAMDNAREWAGRFKVIMHTEDLKDCDAQSAIVPPAPVQALSVSDELRKLKALHEDGLIDADELATQRAKLLR